MHALHPVECCSHLTCPRRLDLVGNYELQVCRPPYRKLMILFPRMSSALSERWT